MPSHRPDYEAFVDQKSKAGEYKPVINWNTIINLLLARPTRFRVEQEILDIAIELPDVSFWQGSISWAVMATKTKSVVIRVGQGSWEDREFKRNWKEAKARKIRRSLYMFFDGRFSPGQHLEVIKTQLAGDLPEGVIWIDWESNFDGKYEGLPQVVKLMKLVEEKFPSIPVGMYTGYYWFIANSNIIANRGEYDYLKVRPLWLAQYGVDSQHLRIPKPWTGSPELHQYGTPARGMEFGCQSREIDMNRVLSAFARYYTGDEDTIPTPPTQEEGEEKPMSPPTTISPIWLRVTATVLNIRNAPGATGSETDLGDLPRNSVLKADAIQMVSNITWYHIVEAYNSEGVPVVLSDGKLLKNNPECWASGAYMVTSAEPVNIQPPTATEPKPPLEVRVRDANGVWWSCKVFERVL